LPTLPPPADPGDSYTAVFDTSAGEIRCELFAADAPQTVGNFVGLARAGFYDGTVFHRVIRDFMIQGGCPQGTGTGGPGYDFPDEINSHKIVRGTLAMANAGPNTNGSQFFLVTAEATPWLDGAHTAFGRVIDGEDVLEAIGTTATDRRDRPKEEQRLNTVRIEEGGGS
jgi:peptidyl-prolyl cis-trans isomerase B (cyclophilin B)